MSLVLYDRALHIGVPLTVQYADGGEEPLPLARWRGGLDAADSALLSRVDGPALDVGCGPGRLTAALARRGVAALGLDVAPSAVRLTRRRGGRAVRADVFAAVPGSGTWRSVLLVDGNVGIGGDPVRLLARVAALLAPAGRVHAEVAPPTAPTGPVRARLATGDEIGGWFAWARLSVDAAPAVARAAGLRVAGTLDADGRWFVELVGSATDPVPAAQVVDA